MERVALIRTEGSWSERESVARYIMLVSGEGEAVIRPPEPRSQYLTKKEHMPTQILINIPSANLEKSKDFFVKIGFSLESELTDENAVCLAINGETYVALLSEERFKAVTNNDVADGTKVSEVLIAVGMQSKKEVDTLVDSAISAGGSELHDPKDLGWLYGRTFADLDQHQWNIFFKDASQAPK